MQASSPMHSCACTEASRPPHELQQDNDLIWKAVASCRPLAKLKMAACLADSNMPLAWQHSSDVWSAPDCKYFKLTASHGLYWGRWPCAASVEAASGRPHLWSALPWLPEPCTGNPGVSREVWMM